MPMRFSNPQLVEVFGSVLPNPVYTFGGFVPEIGRVEIPAEKQHKNHLVSEGCLQLVDLRRLFLAALIDVGEVAGGFSFNQNRQLRRLGALGLDHGVDGDLNGLGVRAGRFYENIQAEAEGAWLHLREWNCRRMRLLAVAALRKILFNQR